MQAFSKLVNRGAMRIAAKVFKLEKAGFGNVRLDNRFKGLRGLCPPLLRVHGGADFDVRHKSCITPPPAVCKPGGQPKPSALTVKRTGWATLLHREPRVERQSSASKIPDKREREIGTKSRISAQARHRDPRAREPKA
jgi:hypothetical protein